MTGLLLVVCSMTLAPVTADAQSAKLVFECGTRRSPCAAEWGRERAVSAIFADKYYNYYSAESFKTSGALNNVKKRKSKERKVVVS